ncbi:MAG: hypothetical protein DA408_00185 [Bacteroidetes bacterium]|nr:MAG: hypothetical protein C7N36_15270 [Bacteroidota bacterium]PTM15073.1 MAG: hypothetical protein DA408_00185 [Bacteroidota bacterium]
MKLVVFTNDESYYGKKMIQELEAAHIPLEAVVVIKQPLDYHLKLFNYVKRRVGWVEALVFAVKTVLEGVFKQPPETLNYEQFATTIVYTKGTNSPETERMVKALAPDVIILAQTGIVRRNILAIPKLGTINGHPAVLPYYRGIDCHKWAILAGDFDKIGATVHWVDKGVDTGNIIGVKTYALQKDEGPDDIAWKLYLLCIDGIRDALLSLLQGQPIKGKKQEKEDGKQYYKMGLKLEREVKLKLSRYWA